MFYGRYILMEQRVIGLFYDVLKNVFIDEDGFEIHNIYEIISPNMVYLFRHHQEYMIVHHRNLPGVVCELFWPDDGDRQY